MYSVYFTLKTIRASEYVESETTKKDNVMAYSVLQGTINFIGIFKFFFLNKMKAIILLIFSGTIKTLHYAGVPYPGFRLVSKEHVFKGSKQIKNTIIISPRQMGVARRVFCIMHWEMSSRLKVFQEVSLKIEFRTECRLVIPC